MCKMCRDKAVAAAALTQNNGQSAHDTPDEVVALDFVRTPTADILETIAGLIGSAGSRILRDIIGVYTPQQMTDEASAHFDVLNDAVAACGPQWAAQLSSYSAEAMLSQPELVELGEAAPLLIVGQLFHYYLMRYVAQLHESNKTAATAAVGGAVAITPQGGSRGSH